MRTLKYILSLTLVVIGFISCNNDEADVSFIDNAPEPTNISAIFTITQDNSGLVTIAPNGEGVIAYDIDFGDSSEPSRLGPGETLQHIYAEGIYNVIITGIGVGGKTTSITQELTVTFAAPENLVVTIIPVPGDVLSVDITATADNETFFEVDFGEDSGADPVPFMEGETIRHTYTNSGDYEIRVVALSGGAATTEYLETVTISEPIILPLDFESADITYDWIGFGAADFGGIPAGVIPNPDVSGINTSDNITYIEKTPGAQVWAGASLNLSTPIDFSETTVVSMKTWAPRVGVPVMFKLEDSGSPPDGAGNPTIFVEIITNTTQANTWETLNFDVATDATFDPGISYDRVIVFYDFGNAGVGETLYFDDIQLETSGLPRPSLPVSFEGAFDYTWNGFGSVDFGAIPSGVIPNPDPSGINTSANVVYIEKTLDAQVWAGASMDLDGAMDFSDGTTISMKVWAPQAGVPVLFKLEDSNSPPDGGGNPTVFVEIITNTTQANTWETLTFDLTTYPTFDTGISYDRVIIFYDFGNTGNGDTSYYDDIELVN
ncbi:MAG: hypothetical protein AAF934_00855 [Bacteroidota bacterium]